MNRHQRSPSRHADRQQETMRSWVEQQLSTRVGNNVRGLFVEALVDVSMEHSLSPEQVQEQLDAAIHTVNTAYDGGGVSPDSRQNLLNEIALIGRVPHEVDTDTPLVEDRVTDALRAQNDSVRRTVYAWSRHVGRANNTTPRPVRIF